MKGRRTDASSIRHTAKEIQMEFLSCFDHSCRTIVAVDSSRQTIRECPTCSKPLKPLASGEAPPIGYDAPSIDPLVEEFVAASWRIEVQVIKR